MSFSISIRADFAATQRRLNDLQKALGDKAAASAINKVVDLGRTQMIRRIAQLYNVTAAYVRQRLRVRRATSKQGRNFAIEGSLIGGREGAKRSANVIAFAEKAVTLAEAKRRRKKGTLGRVFVKIKRGGARKPLAEGAFIGNKGRTVFERVGKARTPIKPVQTIDVAQMFNTKLLNRPVRDYMEKRAAEVFEREARFNARG